MSAHDKLCDREGLKKRKVEKSAPSKPKAKKEAVKPAELKKPKAPKKVSGDKK
mgnify:CR=1 FL=1|tara:strand:- start:721 stop:879 length:159 start_codon:yes stop_codon:yes gene_type:complete